jgi:hypothetical protein
MLAFSLSAFCANPLVSEATGELLANLVRTSLEYDLYNTRCRGNAASTKTDDSNRLLISKYKLTVNQVINQYIGTDFRAERAAIEQAFLQKIGQMGGCNMAKKKGLLEALNTGCEFYCSSYRSLAPLEEPRPGIRQRLTRSL